MPVTTDMVREFVYDKYFPGDDAFEDLGYLTKAQRISVGLALREAYIAGYRDGGGDMEQVEKEKQEKTNV